MGELAARHGDDQIRKEVTLSEDESSRFLATLDEAFAPNDRLEKALGVRVICVDATDSMVATFLTEIMVSGRHHEMH